MLASLVSRRDFCVRLTPLVSALTLTGPFAPASEAGPAAAAEGISHSAESIHQDLRFKATAERIYGALLDEKQFAAITGGAARIDRAVGDAFSLFDGRIKGRNVDLSTNRLIVQAWRSEAWRPTIYSIVRFDLSRQGDTTRLIFDHTGFPVGEAQSLFSGWKSHYWDALEKLV
jgi:activator of HSP90 ATPase